MTTLFIFALLIALMLTGMPISIALGLTVLTFLFFLTQVPIEAVALKLFTGIENFEIMAIPFFILAGNFLTHGETQSAVFLGHCQSEKTKVFHLLNDVIWNLVVGRDFRF